MEGGGRYNVEMGGRVKGRRWAQCRDGKEGGGRYNVEMAGREGVWREGLNTRHFPAQERKDLVKQLETRRETL